MQNIKKVLESPCMKNIIGVPPIPICQRIAQQSGFALERRDGGADTEPVRNEAAEWSKPIPTRSDFFEY